MSQTDPRLKGYNRLDDPTSGLNQEQWLHHTKVELDLYNAHYMCKTMLGQRWHMVVRLAYGWGWKYNVGPTLSLR